MSHYSREDIFRIVEEQDVAFIRLQFCDIFGTPKNIAITPGQLGRAFDHQIRFDGSAIDGFMRTDESDMLLAPDLDTFDIYPWRPQSGKVARMFCNVCTLDGEPFMGDPRQVLRSVLEKAEADGLKFRVDPELEFFLFGCDDEGRPVPETHETAGYFDVAPADWGENVRRDIIFNLEEMDFEVTSSHHEIAPAQHEIDFCDGPADVTADRIQTFKMAVKTIAKKHGYYAAFMPKPLEGINGSGMHINIMGMDNSGRNVFYDEKDPLQLSRTAYQFIAGIMEHAKGITLVTNPLVNSYKRMVPGYDAPVDITWSGSSANRSALINIPSLKGEETRIELRSPDAACNPYLALAVCIAAGMDGIRRGLTPQQETKPQIVSGYDADASVMAGSAGAPTSGNEKLPQTLGEALKAFQEDQLVRDVLGNQVYQRMLEAKTAEWKRFRSCVTQWETDEYLSKF